MAISLNSIKEKLPPQLQKYVNAKTLAAVFIGLFLVSVISLVAIKALNKEDYAVLYTNLDPQEAGEVLTALQEEHIPYKIEGNGTIILVPKDKVYAVRLKLAAKGIPSGTKPVGFELFNEPKLGITQFQENVNYLRALEGELERTIRQLDPVIDAKVNIALPKDSIFVRDEDEAKASVLVKLAPGKDLTKEQVKAIVFLVSRAVPKLKPENVTVVDNRGRVLTDLLDEDKELAAASKNVELKRKLEKQIERSLQSMLAKAVGPGRVIVRASVDVETGKLKQKDEIYNPDQVAVVSERRVKEEVRTTKKEEAGPPGSSVNVPPVINLQNNKFIIEKKKDDRTRNYDVSKSEINKTQPIFRIKKISVGVLIDGTYEKVKDKNGNVKLVFKPRSPEELKQYEELVKSAIGYDPKRGDTVKVVSVPFETTMQQLQSSKAQKAQGLLSTKNIILLAATAILGLSLLIILVALLMKSKKKKEETAGAGYGELSPEVLASMSSTREKELEADIDKDPAYIKILKIADENPQILATIISQWLKEE